MKKLSILITLSFALLLTACSANQNATSEKVQPTPKNAAITIDHIHGLTYSNDGSSLYIATHQGLFQKKNGPTLQKVGKEDIDLMGFQVMPDGTMITSGHPGEQSNLPNPVGFLKSTDKGQTWETISMAGKMDFHVLAPNPMDPSIIYGLSQMDEGEYKAGIYKSADGGNTWRNMGSKGLPSDLMKILSLMTLPSDPNVLLAGTVGGGLMKSEDGAKTWVPFEKDLVVPALEAVPNNKNEILGYVAREQDQGVALSKDGGKTWNKLGLDLGKDAVEYFAVNPKNPEEITASTFGTNVYVSKDGGKNWDTMIVKGRLKQ
jgi:photosystem II stability/assembly factor-like uncharacterized protein